VSQYPRIVLSSGTVTWGQPGCSFFVKAGTVVDIKPGSRLETAYSPLGLSAVIPPSDPRRAPEVCDDLDRSAQAN
jgi:hypothetical protein